MTLHFFNDIAYDAKSTKKLKLSSKSLVEARGGGGGGRYLPINDIVRMCSANSPPFSALPGIR